MDLILTGRGVHGEEALQLAHDVAMFPQRCLRSDRLSAYEQWSVSYEEALRNELRRGVEVVESGETVDGATSFARGQGRHGAVRSKELLD
jgi:enoyl-CoA hydratase